MFAVLSRLGGIRSVYKIIRTAAVAAGLCLPLLGLVPSASASAAKPPPASTQACQVTTPNCTEPVAAVAFPSSQNYVPSSDAALTAFSGGSTFLDPNNTEGDGTQDWAFAFVAIVPHPGGGPGAYHFTGFDRHNYGGDEVAQVEFTPFGIDSGRCLQVLSTHVVVLRGCDGGADQAWIVHFGGLPFVNPPGHPGYAYGLSVLQVANAQHHLCLTGHLFRITTASRCLNKDIDASDTQRWSALP
jgi:hypothetical protein